MRQTCTETLSLIRQISADSGIEADCSVSLFNSPAILTSYGESESWVHLETTTEPLVRQPVRTVVKTTSSAWRCLMAGHSHQTIRDIMRHSRMFINLSTFVDNLGLFIYLHQFVYCYLLI